MSAAKRGKYAEGKVRDWLEAQKQAVACFTYNRILDAGSSRGGMSNPQPGDFQWFMQTATAIYATVGGRPVDMGLWKRNGLLEVKETEHAFRLPFNSFGSDQVGRMLIRQMAGSECLVLICHRPAGVKVYWRAVPLAFFRERPGTQYGSWDLTQFPQRTLDDIMKEHLS